MRFLSTSALLSAIAILAGCVGPKPVSPPTLAAQISDALVLRDVGFVRGCWAEKREPGGPTVGFLRLLPEGKEYAGYLSRTVAGEIRSVGRLAIAQDSSKLTMTSENGETNSYHLAQVDDRRPLFPKLRSLIFEHDTRPWENLQVQGDGDTLALGSSEGVISIVLFERDGCD